MTRERIQEIIARIEMFGHGAGYTVDEVYELASMALAAMGSEPVAWIVHARTGDQLTTDGGYVANAEGILGLHSTPLYRHAQQPVVPDDVLDALQKVARIRLDLNEFDGDRRGIADCLGYAEEALIEVVNRRAAMLSGGKS